MNMDADEIIAYYHDERAGKIKIEDVIAGQQYIEDVFKCYAIKETTNYKNMVRIKDCNRGDIIEVKDTIVVLVDNGCNEGFIFTALPSSYIAVEIGSGINYGYSDSGYDNFSSDDLVKRIGHIELY